MKKILFISLFSIMGAVVLPLSVLAATDFSFSPASIDVESEDDFIAVISIEPEEAVYTVKLELNFPAELLEVKSFIFKEGWIPLSQNEYNLVDNENGLLIKTAGYPGGLVSISEFGTISFSAKQAGNEVINISNNSFALDLENQNILNEELAQLVLKITAPVLVPEPTPPAEEGIEEEIIEEEEIVPEEEMPEEEEKAVILPEEEAKAQPSFLAAIVNIVSFGTGKAWIAIIVAIIILAILAYLVYYFSRKAHRKKFKKFEKPE